MTAPLLVFGWGNASRGDDALGPLLIERLRERLGDDAAVIKRLQLLDEENCDERKKTHGVPMIAVIGLLSLSKVPRYHKLRWRGEGQDARSANGSCRRWRPR